MASLITGCAAQNDLADQYRSGDQKGYISGDFRVVEIAPAIRVPRASVFGRAPSQQVFALPDAVENVAEGGNLPAHEDAATCVRGCHASVLGRSRRDPNAQVRSSVRSTAHWVRSALLPHRRDGHRPRREYRRSSVLASRATTCAPFHARSTTPAAGGAYQPEHHPVAADHHRADAAGALRRPRTRRGRPGPRNRRGSRHPQRAPCARTRNAT